MEAKEIKQYCIDNMGDLETWIGQFPISGKPIYAKDLFEIIESQQEAIKKLEEEKEEFKEKQVSLRNWCEDERKGRLNIREKYADSITENTKLKERIKELENKLVDFERFDFLVEVEIGSKKYQEIKGVITSNPTINKNN